MGTIIYVLFVSLLIVGLFREIALEHDRKIIKMSKGKTKDQKKKLMTMSYFNKTKEQIIKSIK